MTGRHEHRDTPSPASGRPHRCLPCSLAGLGLLAALAIAAVLLLR
ncbi:MAG: hypothetical protein U0S76_04305 [Pseudoxanthomonas sp.]|nr:hypothetical protein [Pseudoxanthomonas sp.]